MFDDFDDPVPPSPAPEVRARVHRRAARIKHQRRMAVGSGAASVVVFVVAIGMNGGLEPIGIRVFEPTRPGPVATSLSPTPTPAPAPSVTRSPRPLPPRATAPVVPPSPTRSPWVLGLGRDASCAPATGLPESGAGPHSALTISVALPETVRSGSYQRVAVTVSNTSDDVYADFELVPGSDGDGLQVVAVDDAGHVSGYRWTSVENRTTRRDYAHVRLAPGESWSTSVAVLAAACVPPPPGRTAAPDVAWLEGLPSGTYRMAVGIQWWGYAWQGPPAPPAPEPSPTGTASPTASPSASPAPFPERPADAVYQVGVWGTAPATVTIT